MRLASVELPCPTARLTPGSDCTSGSCTACIGLDGAAGVVLQVGCGVGLPGLRQSPVSAGSITPAKRNSSTAVVWLTYSESGSAHEEFLGSEARH